MKKIIAVFAFIGVISGLALALAPFIFLDPRNSLPSFVCPILLGLLLAATHRLNWRCLHGSPYPRARLITFNFLLLAVFTFGFVGLCYYTANFSHEPLRMLVFLTFWLLPLVVTTTYLGISAFSVTES